MKKKYWVILIFCLSLSCVVYLKFKNTVDLSEKLPVKIAHDNILYGKIRAYHPDIFYMKYELKFATKNDIEEENANYVDTSRIKNYFYYIENGSKVTNAENTILKNDSAQTYLKIIGQDGTNYIFTVSGDHSGSANYRDLIIKHLHPQSEIDEDWKEDIVGCLGNLLFLDQDMNGAIDNKPFKVKKSILLKKGYALPKFIIDADEWAPDVVIQHTDSLAETAYNEIWKI